MGKIAYAKLEMDVEVMDALGTISNAEGITLSKKLEQLAAKYLKEVEEVQLILDKVNRSK